MTIITKQKILIFTKLISLSYSYFKIMYTANQIGNMLEKS